MTSEDNFAIEHQVGMTIKGTVPGPFPKGELIERWIESGFSFSLYDYWCQHVAGTSEGTA